MANYDQFYKHYDLIMGDPKKKADFLKSLIKKYNPKAKSVLELACGTGAVLKHFTSRFDTHGLDLSKGMLSVARKTLPKTQLFHQDMTKFRINKKFDAILCVFDSINHLTKFADWEKVFNHSAKHLNESGIFIFDINTEYKLKSFVKDPAWVKEFNGNYMIMDVKDEKNGLTNWDIKVFENKGKNQFTFYQENIYEKSFSVTLIRKGLEKHFKKVSIVDYEGNRPNKRSDKIIFVCQK